MVKKAKKTVKAAHDTKVAALAEREVSPTVVAREQRTAAVVTKASGKSVDGVLRAAGELKLSVSAKVDSLTNELAVRIDELTELTEACASKRAELRELHGIEAKAESLEALTQAHVDEENTYELVVEQRKADEADREREVAQARKREQEEYTYNLKKQRQAEADLHERSCQVQQATFDAELVKRQQAVATAEAAVAAKQAEYTKVADELAALKASYAKDTDKAVAIACNSLKSSMSNEHTLKLKDFDVQVQLLTAQNKQLEARNAELRAEVEASRTRVVEASKQIQDIADKAIAGAAQAKVSVYQGSEQQQPGGQRRG